MIVYVGRIYDGANWSYVVSGAPIIFGTKKQAKAYIMANITDKVMRKKYLDDLKKS